jgi:hypothetical protein
MMVGVGPSLKRQSCCASHNLWADTDFCQTVASLVLKILIPKNQNPSVSIVYPVMWNFEIEVSRILNRYERLVERYQ